MEWNLSPIETAGVVAVGLGLGFLTNQAVNQTDTPNTHLAAALAGGTALYTIGVVIGTNRPKKGWEIPMVEAR